MNMCICQMFAYTLQFSTNRFQYENFVSFTILMAQLMTKFGQSLNSFKISISELFIEPYISGLFIELYISGLFIELYISGLFIELSQPPKTRPVLMP